jgi:hypothetical protein
MKTKRCTLEWVPTHEVAAGALQRQKIKRNPTRPIHRSPRPSLSLKQRAFTLFYLLTFCNVSGNNASCTHATPHFMSWSGWRDSNPRPLRPERSALPDCATARVQWEINCSPTQALQAKMRWGNWDAGRQQMKQCFDNRRSNETQLVQFTAPHVLRFPPSSAGLFYFIC